LPASVLHWNNDFTLNQDQLLEVIPA